MSRASETIGTPEFATPTSTWQQQARTEERQTDRQADCATTQEEAQLLTGVPASVLEIVPDGHHDIHGFGVRFLRGQMQEELARARADFARGTHQVLFGRRIQISFMEGR